MKEFFKLTKLKIGLALGILAFIHFLLLLLTVDDPFLYGIFGILFSFPFIILGVVFLFIFAPFNMAVDFLDSDFLSAFVFIIKIFYAYFFSCLLIFIIKNFRNKKREKKMKTP